MIQVLITTVLKNPYIWGMALTYFFIYVIRQGVTSWCGALAPRTSLPSIAPCQMDKICDLTLHGEGETPTLAKPLPLSGWPTVVPATSGSITAVHVQGLSCITCARRMRTGALPFSCARKRNDCMAG